MKKLSKIIPVILMIMMVISTATTVFAAPIAGGVNPTDLTGASVEGTSKIQSLGNQIITILSTVGSVAAVIVLIVLGIKYMMGSAEEKAEYKKTLMPYVIGAALIFAASAIAGILYGFLSNVSA